MDRFGKRIPGNMKKALLIWFICSVLAFISIEIGSRGSHYQGIGSIIMLIYSVPVLFIILIVGLIKNLWTKRHHGSKSSENI